MKTEAFLGWAVDGPDYEMQWGQMSRRGPWCFSSQVGPFGGDAVGNGSAEVLLAVEAADVTDGGAYDDSSLVLLLHDCDGS